MSAAKPKRLPSTNFTSHFFAFTFFYSIVIYLLAISFYFWQLYPGEKSKKSSDF